MNSIPLVNYAPFAYHRAQNCLPNFACVIIVKCMGEFTIVDHVHIIRSIVMDTRGLSQIVVLKHLKVDDFFLYSR